MPFNNMKILNVPAPKRKKANPMTMNVSQRRDNTVRWNQRFIMMPECPRETSANANRSFPSVRANWAGLRPECRRRGVGQLACEPVLARLEDDVGSHAEITSDDQFDELSGGTIHQRLPAIVGDEVNVAL